MFPILSGFALFLLVGMGSAYALAPNDYPTTIPPTTPVPYDLNQKVVCAAGDNPSGDGICDSWKTTSGLQIVFTDTTGGTGTVFRYTLPCNPSATYNSDPTGASVCPVKGKTDVYVELDSMTTQQPTAQAVADVVQSFLNNGVFLHVQTGEHWALNPPTGTPNSGDIGRHYCEVKIMNNGPLHRSSGTASTTNCNPNSPMYTQDYQSLKRFFFGTTDERTSTSPNFATFCPGGETSFQCLTAKRQVFHYGMFAYWQNSALNHIKSGWAEMPGNDFVVSLGSFTNGVGSIDEQEGALMHELGHNLGLTHGGTYSPPGNTNQDDNNCAPNYLSVMSYTYEFGENHDICRPLDYSNKTLNPLIQNSDIMDSVIGSYPYPAFSSSPPGSPVPPGGTQCQASIGQDRPIWFSDENAVVRQGIASDSIINDWKTGDPFPLGPGAPPWTQPLNNIGIPGCTSTANVPLTGFNDWSAIKTAAYPGTSLLIMNFREASSFNGASFIAEIPPTNQSEVVNHLPDTATANTSGNTTTQPQNNVASPNISSLNNEFVTVPGNSTLLSNATDEMEGVGMSADNELTIDTVQKFRQEKIINLANHLNEIYPKDNSDITYAKSEKLDKKLNHILDSNSKSDSKTLWSVYDDLQSIKKTLKHDGVLNINSTDASKQQEVYAIIDDAGSTFGAAGTVPEFGPLAMIMLIISFASILIIARIKSSVTRF